MDERANGKGKSGGGGVYKRPSSSSFFLLGRAVDRSRHMNFYNELELQPALQDCPAKNVYRATYPVLLSRRPEVERFFSFEPSLFNFGSLDIVESEHNVNAEK